MLIVPRDLKPPLILSIALIASCLSTPESPEPELALNATAQASTTDTEQDVAIEVPDELQLQPGWYDPDENYIGGHCNVRLAPCDPYPIGKGKHPRADAICSQVCADTIAHCEDYSTAEIEFCCGHPDQNYRDFSGREFPNKHCMPSGEPNWATRCALGRNP